MNEVKVLAQKDSQKVAQWPKRFQISQILWTRIATQNPERGVVCSDMGGVFQLYAWDVPTGDLCPVTQRPAGVAGGQISADGMFIYYHQDEQGNELGHFVRVPFTGGESESITPTLPPYRSWSLAQSYSGNVSGFIFATEGQFKTCLLSMDGPQVVCSLKSLTLGPILSYDGAIVVVATSERSGTMDFALQAFVGATGEQLAELWDGEGTNIRPSQFSPMARSFDLVATTSKSGFQRPLIWNPHTQERYDLEVAHLEGDIVPLTWSSDGGRLLLKQIHSARHQLHVYDLQQGTLTRLNHPSGVIGDPYSAYFAATGEIFTTRQDSVTPSCLIALDATTGQQTRTLLQAGQPLPGWAWKSITYSSTDGTPIQGWLATPAGDGPFPTILHTHGGPTAVMSDYYFAECQTWLDHGFAFFSINYRGSTTFGKAFEKAIWGRLGDLEVEDMVAAYDWLVENGVAVPTAVFLTGGSYGGYLTLQAMGKRPDLWAGGMAMVAIADWRLMYEDQPEMLRAYQHALFGGSPDECPEAVVESSPISYAAAIEAPILVIQGRNDTRCPARQMEVYEAKLRALGKDITVHWFDAGHGSLVQAQQIEHQALMLDFVQRVLEVE